MDLSLDKVKHGAREPDERWIMVRYAKVKCGIKVGWW